MKKPPFSGFGKKLVLSGILALTGFSASAAEMRTVAHHNNGGASVFNDSGYAHNWLDQFFPYKTPNTDSIYSALGKMLQIYNTGILVLAGILALWSIISLVVETARQGEIGGRQHSSIYAPLRLVIAIGLLTPVSHGYSTAQLIVTKLAHAGSGLANSAWQQFTPLAAATDFSLPGMSGDTVSGFLQQALIDETCTAAVALDQGTNASVTVQALYRNPGDPQQELEGAENPLTLNAANSGIDAMSADGAITTEAQIRGSVASRLRIHFNRSGYDDYCGSLDVPVPSIPAGETLQYDDQTLYLRPYLKVRPFIGKYAQQIAMAVNSAIMTQKGPAGGANSTNQPQPATPSTSGASPAANAAPAASNGQGAGSTPKIELPQIPMSPSSWDALINETKARLAEAAAQAEKDYIEPEVNITTTEKSDADWVWAGSLFFRLGKLSHDNLKLRYQMLSADLPVAAILPAEMRADGLSAQCLPILDTVFLADYNCRPEGKKTTLALKVAYNLIHNVESQRGGDVVTAIDGGGTASRKKDNLSTELSEKSGFEDILYQLRNGAGLGSNTATGVSNSSYSSMFDAVNIGNVVFMATSSLFREAGIAGQTPGGFSTSTILILFAVLTLPIAVFLSICLPLFPAMRFFFGIATWLVMVFEALVAFPLVALSQLRGDGEGLLAHGRQGYLLLLQMLLRPVLMVFGLMAAVMIFDALYGFITWALWSVYIGITDGDGQSIITGTEGALELLGYLFFWTFLIYMAANIAFAAITALPDRVLLWISSQEIIMPKQVQDTSISQTAMANYSAAALTQGAAGANGATSLPGGTPTLQAPGSVSQNDRMISQISYAKDPGKDDVKPANVDKKQKNTDHIPKTGNN